MQWASRYVCTLGGLKSSWKSSVVGQFQSANFTISSIVQMWSLTPAAIVALVYVTKAVAKLAYLMLTKSPIDKSHLYQYTVETYKINSWRR